MEYRVVTTHRPWLVAASPLSRAARPWSLSSPGVGEVGAYCSGSRPSRMSSARRSPTSWASRRPLSNAPCALPAIAASPKKVRASLRNRSDEAASLLARALAVEGPRKDGVAPRPVLMRQVRRPLRHQRGLPLAAEGDEGEDVGALRFAAHGLVPGVVEELGFGLAPDEFRRGVFDDAGDVGFERGGFRYDFLRCLVRGDVAGRQRLDVVLEAVVSDGIDLKVEDGLHRFGAAARIAAWSTDSSRTGTMFRRRSSARRSSRRTQSVSSVQRSSAPGSQQKNMRPLRDLREDLLRPLARIDTVNVQEDVVATSFERPFDQPRKKVAHHVPPVTDEDGLLTHDVQARVESSTAAKHRTENRGWAKGAGPETVFHGAIVGVLLGGSEG